LDVPVVAGDDTKRHVAMQSLPPGMSTALGSPPVEVEKFPVPDGYSGWNIADLEPFLSITVVGATGDLARNKIFPALFALYHGGSLPKVGKLRNNPPATPITTRCLIPYSFSGCSLNAH
jgi:hypothetical protein